MTGTGWHGGAWMRPGVLAFTGAIGATDTHAHHAVQIMTATTALTVLDAAGHTHSGRQVIVPADTAHRITTGAATGTVIFLDPETAAGAAAHRRAARSGWTAGPALPGSPDEGAALGETVTELLAVLTPVRDPEGGRHPAVSAALELLPDLIAEGPVGTGELAARVGISASRLTHLFTTEVGLPVRRYVLWQRLLAAITTVAAGDDLTTAAHVAGFADSAHLTRTCRENFGLPPSALSRNIHWHK